MFSHKGEPGKNHSRDALASGGNLGGTVCAGVPLWGEPHARGMQYVQGAVSQGPTGGHPKKAVVPLLLLAIGQPTLPVLLTAGLTHPQMHAHAPQVVA